jgi:pimeloyl-ACP methyl ester carboxylesterase
MSTHPMFVTSRDGTLIASRRLGSGPMILIIGGALTDHTSYLGLAEELATQCTVVLWDRRGRGASSDADAYDPSRELEDIEALLDEHAGPVSVYGHSSGAALALRAAASQQRIHKLVLGDPPFSALGEGEAEARREHAEQEHAVRSLVARNDMAGAVRLFLSGFGLSDGDLDALLASPSGQSMCRLARTLPYDYAMLGDGVVPSALAAMIPAPALVLTTYDDVGPHQLAEALPNGRVLHMPAPLHMMEPAHYAPMIGGFVCA